YRRRAQVVSKVAAAALLARPLHEGLVVVLTTPRSASNNLTRSLAQHPEILMVEEIFNRDLQIVAGKATVLKRPGVPLHDVAPGYRSRIRALEVLRRAHPESAVRLARGSSPKEFFGFKVLGRHVAAYD